MPPYIQGNTKDRRLQDMLIKKGVSIPAVARLMRHKDGGGLLLKKYTQGFEEKGLTITM